VKLREAQSAHRRRFPQGSTDAAASKSQVEIHRLTEDLHWARRNLEARQKYADQLATHDAREENARLPKNRIFEVRDAHGRVIRHRAASADHLRRELTHGYVVTAEIFGFAADGSGGLAAALDATAPTLMSGLLAAFGDELVLWLEQKGFERNDPPEAA
jgi:hypothetical protein